MNYISGGYIKKSDEDIKRLNIEISLLKSSDKRESNFTFSWLTCPITTGQNFMESTELKSK